MDREEWEYSSHSLRKLLHKFNEEDMGDREIEYCFGLRYNPLFNFYHLWDGKIAESMATIKLETKRAIIRFQPEWLFKQELLKFKIEDKDTVFIMSANVARHGDWVHEQLQNRVERSMRERGAFLETGSPNIVTIHIPDLSEVSPMSQGVYGLRDGAGVPESQPTRTIRVDFGSVPTSYHIEQATEMFRFLVEYDNFHSSGRTALFSIGELSSIYRASREHSNYSTVMEEWRRELARMPDTMFRDGTTEATIYGRPIEQLSGYFSATNTIASGQPVTPSDLQGAVRELDQMNIPEETAIWDRDAIAALILQTEEERNRNVQENQR